MNHVYLKPERPNLIVRKPDTRLPLAADGEYVVMTAYWKRRLADGDVVRGKPPKSASDSKSSQTAAD